MELVQKAGVWPGRSAVTAGLKRVAPVVLGFVPVGFAYGVLASKAGLSACNVVAMSVIVFAGSAQLASVALFALGAPALAVVAATFVINLRHLLMSAALAPFLRSWPAWRVAAMTFQLTDETFALHAVRFPRGNYPLGELFTINVTAQTAWVAGTVLGLAASGMLADVRPLGLDFALPAMFAALLAFQLKDRVHVLVAVVSGAGSLLFLDLGA
ncbi:MAG: AzlC family ABC transporter permease, partial [Desulfovibrionaceae bacterium]